MWLKELIDLLEQFRFEFIQALRHIPLERGIGLNAFLALVGQEEAQLFELIFIKHHLNLNEESSS